jgi:hypothetical protein
MSLPHESASSNRLGFGLLGPAALRVTTLPPYRPTAVPPYQHA